MASPLDMLLDAVKNSIGDHAGQQAHTGFDPSALINQVTNIFGQHQAQHGNSAAPIPASQDPYGDPGLTGANVAGRVPANVKPASADPYGDPADQK